MANPLACQGALSFVATDSQGKTSAEVWPDGPGTMAVTIRSATGTALADVPVTFKTNDSSAADAVSRTVKTDVNGVARATLFAGTKAGSFTAEAVAVVNGSVLQSSLNYRVVFPTLALSMTDSSNSALTQVSPGNTATVQARIKQPDGKPVPNVVVRFDSDDPTTRFEPASKTALTDADGVARIALPVGTTAGAYVLSAKAVTKGLELSSSTNYTAVFPTLVLSGPISTPASISSRGSAGIGVTVMNGAAPYAVPLEVKLSSDCVTLKKATLESSVLTRGGVATATYTDLGCDRGTDEVTATVSLGGRTFTQKGTVSVLPRSAGSITFVTADASVGKGYNLALVGTGGAGRQESAQLKFRVLDVAGQPSPNVLVNFSFADSGTATTVGGLNVNPPSGYSDANGEVTTTVSGGTIPTSVRVMAGVQGSAVRTVSNLVSVSSGVPDERHFTVGPDIGNCEGYDINQTCAVVTATLADHFSNNVPDGTVVNFSSEGGSIEPFCLTVDGSCKVTLRSGRPRPGDGRVTVLAYTLGEENFNDLNGNNRCDNCDDTHGEFRTTDDLMRDIFRDDDENGAWTAGTNTVLGEPCIGPNDKGDCATPGDGRYNGVLRVPAAPATPPTVYLSRQFVMHFSGTAAKVKFVQPQLSCPANGQTVVQFTVTDTRDNPMPANTTIALGTTFSSSDGSVRPAIFKVDNFVLALKQQAPIPTYSAVLSCPGTAAGEAMSGYLMVTVTPPSGLATEAQIKIN